MRIKIVTINTWKCDGEYRTRLKLLATQLKSLQPNVIACQECFSNLEAMTSTLDFLANELQMNYQFVEGRSKKRWFENNWVESSSGLGVLSNYPITELAVLDLPTDEEDTDRKVQQVVIDLPKSKKLLVTNTHITHVGHTPLRKMQLDYLAEIISLDHTYQYHILCGDFNTTIDSEDLVDFMHTIAAIDCYKAGLGEEPRYSMAIEFILGKMVCVDHILSQRSNDHQCEFENSGIVLNSIDEQTGLYPSDHFGIATTLIVD